MQCQKVCKYDAISSTGDYRPIVNIEACTGCGACVAKCPLKEKAIVVTNYGEKRREV
jgi:MinD superfamily P-loop ATPase